MGIKVWFEEVRAVKAGVRQLERSVEGLNLFVMEYLWKCVMIG